MSTDRPPPAAPGAPSAPEPFWRSWAVGERVIVRYRLDGATGTDADPTADGPRPRHPTGGGPSLTDALGYVLSVDDQGVSVRTRRGDVAVPASAITLGKRVPPPPPPRHRVARPAPQDESA